jgi:hypothetical protein
MLTTYLIVTVLAAAANLFSATCDFVRYKKVSIAMAKAGVPESWMTVLGILKAAGALGLLIGFRVPLIGTAAAIGLILFLSAPSSPICAHTTTRSVSRLRSSCWPWPHWCYDSSRREKIERRRVSRNRGHIL